MRRNDRAEVDAFLSNDSRWQKYLEMSRQAANAGIALDRMMERAYSHEKYLEMEKAVFLSLIDYRKRHQWDLLVNKIEKYLFPLGITNDIQWLDYLWKRTKPNVPDGVKEDLVNSFLFFINSGIYEEGILPKTEQEFEFYNMLRQAQNGNIKAMSLLSHMYLQGYGCHRDESYSVFWLKMAACAGHAESRRALDEIMRGLEEGGNDDPSGLEEIEKENDPKYWLKLGNDTRRAGNYQEAISHYKRAIELGSTEAKGALSGLERMLNQKNITEYIQRGNEFRKYKDYSKATECYEKAIKLGSPEAEKALNDLQNLQNMAEYIQRGDEFRRNENYFKAIEYYEEAIKLGSYEAERALKDLQQEIIQKRPKAYIKQCIKIGYEFEKAESYSKAIEFYEKAADLGDRDAVSYIADIYYFNLKNEIDSFKWYKKAADLGDPRCMYNTAMGYEYGRGTEKNLTKAFEWVQKSADLGYVNAMCSLGDYYCFGKGTKIDIVKSNQAYKKAIEAGTDNLKVMNNLGTNYLVGRGIEKDSRKAFQLLLKVAESDKTGEDFQTSSMRVVGAMYYHGDGIRQDYDKAFYWSSKAAEKGDDFALYTLGMMYSEGHGVKRNFAKAKECYTEAIHRGNKEAIKALAELEEKILASKNKKSGCFITTAVCDSFRKSDNCYELTSFRFFRDNWLIDQLDGASLIAEYYSIAPKIVDKINRLKNSGEIYQSIWDEWLSSCLKLIEQGRNEDCKIRYINMVNHLKKTFLAN